MTLIRFFYSAVFFGAFSVFSSGVWANNAKLTGVQKPPEAKVMAQVGEVKITFDEVLQKMRQVLGERVLELQSKDPKGFERLFVAFRDQYVGFKLLVTQSKKEKAGLLKDAENTKKYDQVVEELLVSFLIKKHIDTVVTESSLKEAHKNYPQTSVGLSRIVVSSEAKAKSILAALKSGKKTFEELAKNNSEDESTSKNGGLMEPVLFERLDQRLRAQVKNLKPGENSSEPLKIGDRFVILKLNMRAPASFEQAQPMLREIVTMREVQKLMQKLKLSLSAKVYNLDGSEAKDALSSPAAVPSPAG